MGNEASLPMEMATNFDAEEIKRLGKRFKKLDLDNSGSLSVDEFMSLPELQQVISSSDLYLTRFYEVVNGLMQNQLRYCLFLESFGTKGNRHI